MEYQTKPDLKTMKPIGNGVNAPVYKEGETVIIATKSANMTNSGTDLNISASNENLSAKFKNPRNRQDTGIMYTGQK